MFSFVTEERPEQRDWNIIAFASGFARRVLKANKVLD